jgi:hypothetical protein
MDSQESTVWKNKLFSDDNSTQVANSSSEHPDVTSITKKINVIKKQRQYVENFNHMKPLSNVYEEPFAQQDHDEAVEGDEEPFAQYDDAAVEGDEEPFAQQDGGEYDRDDEQLFTTENIESLKGKPPKMKPIKIKPIKMPTKKQNRKNMKPVKDFYNSDAYKKKAAFEEKIFNGIFWIPNKIEELISKGCYSFIYACSKLDGLHSSKETMKKDSESLHIILSYSISFVISYWATYNWFFLLAYIDEGGEGFNEENKQDFRPASNKNRMKIPPGIIETYPQVKGIYYFLLEFVTAPIWVVDQFFLGDSSFPKLFSIIPYRIISKFLIFIFSFIMVYSVSLSDSIRRVVFGKTTDHLFVFTIICTFIILYQVFTSLYANYKIDSKGNLAEMKIGTIEILNRPWWGHALLMIYHFIRLVIGVLSINASIIGSIFFFWFHSIFGMSFYSEKINKVIPFYRLDKLMQKVDDYVNEDLEEFKKVDEECINPSIIQKIINFVVIFLHKNLVLFVYLLVLIASAQKSLSRFNSSSLQQIISLFIVIAMFIVCLFMHQNMKEST